MSRISSLLVCVSSPLVQKYSTTIALAYASLIANHISNLYLPCGTGIWLKKIIILTLSNLIAELFLVITWQPFAGHWHHWPSRVYIWFVLFCALMLLSLLVCFVYLFVYSHLWLSFSISDFFKGKKKERKKKKRSKVIFKDLWHKIDMTVSVDNYRRMQ